MAERSVQQTDSIGGILMLLAAMVAFALANSPWNSVYQALLAVPLEAGFGELRLAKPLLLWINDGLMAVFFLLVGLEIKREILDGELSTPSKLALPMAAAAGGMVIPALIYAAFNWNDPIALRGWAIPSATDIAFALAALALLGRGVPLGLRLFLITVAIADDIGAIAIIAIFYADDLSLRMLTAAGIAISALVILNVTGVRRLVAFLLVGIVLWVCVLKSGVHATLAGVVTAFLIPFRTADPRQSPGRHLEAMLHPWVVFAILPLFALANAGVPLAGAGLGLLAAPIPLGIIVGLVVGKTAGVFAMSWLVIRLKLAGLPDGAGWLHMLGLASLCGIGFTMSLFIGTLAFPTPAGHLFDQVKLGVLCGSMLSTAIGCTVLKVAQSRGNSSTV